MWVKRRDGAGSNLGMFFFFFFSPSFCLYMYGNGEGFVHFLRIVAKCPPAFPK